MTRDTVGMLRGLTEEAKWGCGGWGGSTTAF